MSAHTNRLAVANRQAADTAKQGGPAVLTERQSENVAAAGGISGGVLGDRKPAAH